MTQSFEEHCQEVFDTFYEASDAAAQQSTDEDKQSEQHPLYCDTCKELITGMALSSRHSYWDIICESCSDKEWED